MSEAKLRALLDNLAQNKSTVDEVLTQLKHLPLADLHFARLDHHRTIRLGFPEVVLGSCKTSQQIAAIISELGKNGDNILCTRVEEIKANEVLTLLPHLVHYPLAQALVLRQAPVEKKGRGTILIVTAGTGDIPVAEEACLTAELMGNEVDRLFDVGVAGIHRVLNQQGRLAAASVIIVVAGMEGALASVIGGLVPRPIIAVPTSIGYGTSFKGIAALLGMLNSCAPGISVVNIDNGFGAAYAASLINQPSI